MSHGGPFSRRRLILDIAALEDSLDSVIGTLPIGASGNTLFVDSTDAAADDDILTNGGPSLPLATLAYAVSQATPGDRIIVKNGHAETLTSAITVADIGVEIIGLGHPTITINGNVDAIDITAADVVIDGLRFLAGTAAHTARINIGAARATIRNCHFDCGANDLTSITIPDAGDDAIIEDCFFLITANGPDRAIELESANTTRVTIRRCHFNGSSLGSGWDNAAIYSAVDCTRILIKDCTSHFGPFLTIGTSATGLVQNCVATNTGGTMSTMFIAGNCMVHDCWISVTAAGFPEPAGNQLTYGRRAVKTITAANGEVSIFNVAGGEVFIRAIYGKVTTQIGATVATMKIVANPTATGSTLDLCTAVAVTSDAVGVLYSCDGTVGNALDVDKIGAVATLARPFIVATGVIGCTFSADPVGGEIEWTVIWEPLTPGATVVAA